MAEDRLPGFSAGMGARDAERIAEAIKSSLALVEQMQGSRALWWGGFFAALAGMCYGDIGAEAHDIILAVTREALLRATKPAGQRTQ